MANRYMRQDFATLESGVVKLFGSITIGTSGAVDAAACKGFSVVKTATETGRYTITLEDKYVGFLNAVLTLEGLADTALTTAAGNILFLRNVNMTAGTLDVQCAAANGTPADANPTSGCKIWVELTLKNSTAY